MEKRSRTFETRAGEKPLTLEGLAIPYDQPTRIGEGEDGFTECIRSGALEGVSLEDVCLFLNHESRGLPLARTPKTMTLSATERGLEFSATLPDTETGRGVYEAVKRGDITKMSFAFDTVEESWNEETRERSITKLGHVYELSLVNYPAYESTEVQARNKKEEEKEMPNPILNNLENRSNNPDTHGTAEYRSAFLKSLLGQKLADNEQRAYDAARAERRDDSFNTLTSSASVIPTQMLNEILSQARPEAGLYNEVRVTTMPANVFFPIGTPTDPAAWHEEGAPVERKDISTTGVTFKAYELMKVLSMSAAVRRMEISAFEKYLTQELRLSVTDALTAAVVNGTGSGQPTGILSGITWKTSGTGKNALTTTELTPGDLLALIALLPSAYHKGAKFAMSTATLYGDVYPLQDGTDRYFMFFDNANGGQKNLFGIPFVLDDNIPRGTVLYGNFRYYGVNLPQGVLVETSRESGFTSGLIDYRALAIADGKPIMPEAFAKLTISNG